MERVEQIESGTLGIGGILDSAEMRCSRSRVGIYPLGRRRFVSYLVLFGLVLSLSFLLPVSLGLVGMSCDTLLASWTPLWDSCDGARWVRWGRVVKIGIVVWWGYVYFLSLERAHSVKGC